jgi:HNH endonuclease
MRYSDIRRCLKAYSIVANRTTTVNHAFAAAIAPCDPYDEQRTRDAVRQLGQDPDRDLACVYCGSRAETWDHVHATVRDKKFSGFGHRLGNLVPCCKPCNSQKGNKIWSVYLDSLGLDGVELARRKRVIEAYLAEYRLLDAIPEDFPEYQQLQELRRQVLEIFAQADILAAQLRLKAHAT